MAATRISPVTQLAHNVFSLTATADAHFVAACRERAPCLMPHPWNEHAPVGAGRAQHTSRLHRCMHAKHNMQPRRAPLLARAAVDRGRHGAPARGLRQPGVHDVRAVVEALAHLRNRGSTLLCPLSCCNLVRHAPEQACTQ